MCGICGIAGKYDKQKPVIENMMKSIYHRGPDGGGSYIDEDVALGFRRLSIIDLDCGNQPMYNETGEVVIVFNGEIYNYQELTKELQEKGHVFANHSDTECLIHAYEEYHEKMLKKLRGMFGFAIWDSKEKTLFAARDFFGIKPFYYAEVNGNLVFASEIKAILEYPEYKRELNEKALSHYLSFQYSAMDETFFKGIYKLNPGCCLKYKDGKLKVSRYFDPTLAPEKKQDEKAIVQEIKERVAESIEAHKVSDVEVGSLLSGGVDSNYIAAQGHFQNTFTVGFAEDNGRYSEMERAREIADYAGSTCHQKVITPEEYWAVLPKVQYHMDEPLADPSAVALWFVDELAASKLKVVMSGEGADELFGGYPMYLAGGHFDHYSHKVPRPVRKVLGTVAKHCPNFKGKNFLVRGAMEPYQRFMRANYVFQSAERQKFLKRPIACKVPEEYSKRYFNEVSNLDEPTQLQYVDMHTWMIYDILLKADRMSMANSLELRVPFLDKKMLELSTRIPSRYRAANETTKIALRGAAIKQLPERTANKKKLGFPVPLNDWLREDKYYNKVKAAFQSDIAEKFFVTSELMKLLDDHKSGKALNMQKIWSFYTFILWYEQFFVLN